MTIAKPKVKAGPNNTSGASERHIAVVVLAEL